MECQICGGETERRYLLENREIVECESCGIGQVANPPGIDELEVAELKYQETKRRDYERHPQWEIEAETINELAPSGGKVLDVGCGDGTFLSMLGGNWQKFGVEINLERAEQAKAKGIDVQVCDITHADFPLEFDLVTMYEVIEHFYRPTEALRRAKAMLAPEGLLVISTPDSESALAKLRGPAWWSYRYPPHIFFFGHTSFERMIEKYSFRVIKRRFGIHGSPLRGKKARKLEDLTDSSPLVAKRPLGDRMFYYLRKD